MLTAEHRVVKLSAVIVFRSGSDRKSSIASVPDPEGSVNKSKHPLAYGCLLPAWG